MKIKELTFTSLVEEINKKWGHTYLSYEDYEREKKILEDWELVEENYKDD